MFLRDTKMNHSWRSILDNTEQVHTSLILLLITTKHSRQNIRNVKKTRHPGERTMKLQEQSDGEFPEGLLPPRYTVVSLGAKVAHRKHQWARTQNSTRSLLFLVKRLARG